MQIITAALISALAITSNAATILKTRDAPSTPPSYSVNTVLSDGTSTNTQASYGSVFLTFNPTNGAPFLTHAAIENDPNSVATCVARDQWGNQVRAFGGPNFGGVEAVDFVENDGRQIFTLSCFPA